MQGRSPEPCRCRHRTAQAGRPHRRTRWEALRHVVGRDRLGVRHFLRAAESGCSEGATMSAIIRDDFRSLHYLLALGGVAAVTVVVFFGVAFLWLTPPQPGGLPADPGPPPQALAADEGLPPAAGGKA